MNIPKIIYSTWKSKTNLGNFTESVESIKKHNKNFKYIIYDDEDCNIFVKNHYPEYYKYYTKLELPVQKADLWRYLIIYYYGGWYCDMDIYSYKSFETIEIPLKYELINENEDLMIVEQEFPAPLKPLPYNNIQYAQYWFGATPRHPVLLKIINKVIDNIKNMKCKNQKGDDYTLHLTGPVPFTNTILKYKNNNVYIIEPNISDTLSQPLFNISSFLGEWKNIPVVHRCEGSWRTSNNNYIIIIIVIVLAVLSIYNIYKLL